MDGKYPLQGLKVIPNKKSEDQLFIVKKILDHKSDGVKRLYLVQWEGLGDETSWEPEENFIDKKFFNLVYIIYI
jgi:hypothetical protein